MPKRICKFNCELEKDFPFIKKTKSDSDVRCETCGTDFTVSHGGRSDITKHIKSDRHKLALSAASSSSVMTKFFKTSTFGAKEIELAAAEGVLSYHTVCHNQSFRSMDCTSKLVQKLFQPKFSCARTKSEAVVVNVLAPFVEKSLKSDLEKAKFVSVYIDASNHKELKLFPILVRYFDISAGVQVKLLEMQSLPGETSEIISNYLVDVLRNKNLSGKIMGFCSDNTNTNFGGAARKGDKNVYFKLKDAIKQDIVGIGCAAHVINNTVQTAADGLPIDVEAVIVKIYSHFYIYTVRVEAFKEFCEEASIEYQKLLGYSKTRWLALMPAVERILKLFEALKDYFLANEKCPRLIRDFFDNPCAELWLYFVHSQASLFHVTVLQVEGQHVTAVEVALVLAELRQKYEERLKNRFLTISVRSCLKKVQDAEGVDKETILSTVDTFYETCISYLKRWYCHFEDMEKLAWVTLKETPSWENVLPGVESLTGKFSNIVIDDSELFDEITYLTKFVTNEKMKEWSDLKTAVDQRWVEIFAHFVNKNVPTGNVKLLVELVLCLPGTNAAVERVFTLMNNMWTENKSQLKIETLKAMLLLKCNIGLSCDKFYELIKQNPGLLERIHSSDKYGM